MDGDDGPKPAGDELESAEAIPPWAVPLPEIVEHLVSSVAMQSWSAPLPKPSDMVAYNEAQPDASERIFKMVEREQDAARLEMWLSFAVMTLGVAGSMMGLYLERSAWIVGMPPVGSSLAVGGYFLARRFRRHGTR